MRSTEAIIESGTIFKEVIIKAPVSKVWEAITKKELVEKWFMKSNDYEPVTGNIFHMTGTGDDCTHVHTCTIREIIPQKKFSYTWSVEGITGESLVVFELREENGNTKLTLTHSGWENVTVHNPALSQNEHENGWEALLNIVLKNFIENKK